jgi:SnoaL-like protein
MRSEGSEFTLEGLRPEGRSDFFRDCETVSLKERNLVIHLTQLNFGRYTDMAGSELEKRITQLEDIEAIKQLKALYCDICDDNHNPDRIVKIFAEDGIWEGGDFGKAQGYDAIRNLFEGFAKLISFSQHNVFNPRIEVDGNRAKGIWYFLGPFTFRQDNGARWIAARYDDDYVKLNGVWLYQNLRATIRMVAPYEKGWAK